MKIRKMQGSLFSILDDYFFIFYLSVSWLVLTVLISSYFQKEMGTIITYSVAILIVFLVFLANKQNPVKNMGLTFSSFSGKMFLWMLPLFIFGNVSLMAFAIFSDGRGFQFPEQITLTSILIRVFGSPIRTMGEEIIFRGWLFLKPEINENNKTFWTANIVQAVIFTSIHALIPQPGLYTWMIFVSFVFVSSILYGMINRKFKSIWPSAILHATNGLYGYFLLAV